MALALAAIGFAGCGSSSSGNTETTVVTVGGKTTTVTAPNGKSTTTPSGAVKPGSGLRVDTTPKYASPSPSAPVQSGVVQIEYRNITINPDTLRVKVGSTVKWTNDDAVEHNVTSRKGPDSFASKNFGEGHSFEVKLTKTGVINYVCTNHPASMNGTIEVVS
jgi:plastocyanin